MWSVLFSHKLVNATYIHLSNYQWRKIGVSSKTTKMTLTSCLILSLAEGIYMYKVWLLLICCSYRIDLFIVYTRAQFCISAFGIMKFFIFIFTLYYCTNSARCNNGFSEHSFPFERRIIYPFQTHGLVRFQSRDAKPINVPPMNINIIPNSQFIMNKSAGVTGRRKYKR